MPLFIIIIMRIIKVINHLHVYVLSYLLCFVTLKVRKLQSGSTSTVTGLQRAGVIADFVPPQLLSPRTESASGLCPPGQNPLADSVRGDTFC